MHDSCRNGNVGLSGKCNLLSGNSIQDLNVGGNPPSWH